MNSKKYNFVYLNAKYLSGLRIINIKNLEVNSLSFVIKIKRKLILMLRI